MTEQLAQYAPADAHTHSQALPQANDSISSERDMPEPISRGSISSREAGVIVRGRLVKMAHPDLDKYEAIMDPEATVAELKRVAPRIDIFTFIQTMADKDRTHPYKAEHDNLAILPVSTFDDWWNKQIKSYPRNRARQAEKRGVVIKEVPFDDDLVRGIWEVYNETKVRQGRPNTHYGKDVETVGREEATYLDRSVFIGAYLDGKLIGFVKLVFDVSRMQASLMNISAMVCHRDKATTNALIAHSVRACADRGIPYLMYQNFEYRNRGTDSMSHFKEINGFQRVDVARYFVPLTGLGRVALALGMHRRFLDRLPQPVSAAIRNLRSSWYNRNAKSEAEGA
jgi:hypothetical protein